MKNATCAQLPNARTVGFRAGLAPLLTIAVLAFSEPRARAEANFTNGLYTVIGGPIAGTASVPFVLADLAYTVQGEWLPPGWAITQIVIGGGVDAAVAGWGASVHSQECGRPTDGCGGVLALTLATSVLSVAFIAHGVVSLNLYQPEPTAKTSRSRGPKPQGAKLRWVPDVVVTRDHGTLVVVNGVF